MVVRDLKLDSAAVPATGNSSAAAIAVVSLTALAAAAALRTKKH